jgi:hypothetical protein
MMKNKYQKEGNQSCVTAGGCSKPKPPRLKPEVERSVAASINRSARSESERRNMYERAGIQYQSVSASTRPARTFDIPAKKTEPKKVIKKKPQEETISKPDTTYKYYKRSSGEKAFQEKNLKATSSTQLTSPNVFNKGGKMPLKKASGKGKAAVQKAVSTNIAELTRANREKPAGKKRSKEQIAAIAYSAARKK